MTKIQKLKLILPLITCFLLFSTSVRAAELKINSPVSEIAVGQQFQVDLILNAEGDEFNAVEGSVTFPNNLAELKEIRDGDSIISLWIERPKINEDKIEFSGIIPGGYKEINGFLFSAIFTAKTEGKGIIEFQESRVLKNDGSGTPIDVKISNFQFLISKQIPISQIPKPQIKDIESPESFRPEIAKDEMLFDGKWFVVFATQDKISGIDRYFVHESQRMKKRIATNKWIEAKSPYVLNDQNLRSFIYVKAVDKAGNERIIKIAPRNPLVWYEKYEIWVIITIVIITAIALFWVRRKKEKLKMRSVNS